MNELTLFIIITIVNVVASTIKSIITVKGNALTASFTNAIYYSLYCYVMIFTVQGNLPIWAKALVTFGCNFIGVFIVKWFEAKSRKEKLWLVKMTIPAKFFDSAKKLLEEKDISFTYYPFPSFIVFDCFCATSNDTKNAMEICKLFEGKMFASENKLNF